MSVAAPLDYTAIKQRQQAVWSAGDYAISERRFRLSASDCARLSICAREAACSMSPPATGMRRSPLRAASLEVTSTDYVGALLERGKERAAAERLAIDFQEADAEALPFADGSFDVALSTFGVMFTPNQEKAAAELVRVVHKGGKIGLANWTPEGFIGQLLKACREDAPPPAGIKPPTRWGAAARLGELFQGKKSKSPDQTFTFRYEFPEHWLHVFRSYYGPMNRAFAALDAEKAAAMEADILDLVEKSNWATAGSLVIPGKYLEAVISKA